MEHKYVLGAYQCCLCQDWTHLSPSLILGDCSPPTLLVLGLFNLIRVPNFGASLRESLDQSRDHTLLPKRPRMPAKGFIGGDWILEERVGAGQRKGCHGNTSA